MPYRQNDWRCSACEQDSAHFVWVDTQEDGTAQPPEFTTLTCKLCGTECMHRRVLSVTAYYTYDRPLCPEVYGGRFDTQGYRRPPPLPEIPAGRDFDEARDRVHSKAAKDAWRERHAVLTENRAKRARAKAIKEGANIDLRSNPLPGDPPLERVAKPKRKGRRKLLRKV